LGSSALARALHAADTPRSYVVEASLGDQLRRNQLHLRIQQLNPQETILLSS